MADMRELSRTKWTTEQTSIEAINCGSMLRMADAMEKVAVRHTELIAEVDRYKRWYAQEQQAVSMLSYRIRSLKGQITKLKKAKAA